MAVSMRLKRLGKKKKPVYRLVVADKRNPRDGKTIEDIGQYNPLIEPIFLKVNEERVKYWISVGAQPTQTVQRLLSTIGLYKQKPIQSSHQKTKKKDLKKSTEKE